MKLGKKLLSIGLALAMSTSVLAGSFSASAVADAGSGFYDRLVSDYASPDIENRTEVRWWMAEGAHTDETLEEEVQAIYDAGFRGIELCQLNVSGLDAGIYGYGSEQWNHDFHLVLNKALDLGMTVGLTSGTNWNTANIPGLDPDSQAANQCVFQLNETLTAGESRTGAIPTGSGLREKATFMGAYAYKKAVSGNETSAIEIDPDTIIDLTDQVQLNADNRTGALDWTAPDDGEYILMYFWQQGTAQESKPAVEAAYCINYFDEDGLDALKEYWLEHVLNDPILNEKMKNGDVQLFMDSLEYDTGKGFANWTDDFAEEFEARKGYDITPYLILGVGLPQPKGIDAHPEVYGTYNLTDADLGQRILNDFHDVQTELYMENLLYPFKEWLNSYGITLRVQISYGKYLEISEPSMAVDYPETENLNQANQIEMYRLWTGGAHLENKVLSSETAAHGSYSYVYDYQTQMQEAYVLYAAGVSRINWHIWTSQWAPTSVAVDWPGFRSMSSFNVLSLREPGYSEYQEFNDHLGRVQHLLREGKSRTDIGMVHMKYGELILAPSRASTQKHQNWMLRHEVMPGYFQSTELQDNGYTYDYFSPEFFCSEDVYYNPETETLELAGYKALVLYEDWLTIDGAQAILDYAKQGLKVVVQDGAAVQTPYNDGNDDQLKAIMDELKALPTVKTAATADDVYEALKDLGVAPYAEFAEENYQLLTQVREDGDDMYLYAYNYCNDQYCGEDHASGMGHGLNIQTEIKMDGTFIPYYIDAWTGEVSEVANYRYENGKTVFAIDLDYGDIALYAFEAVDEEKTHVVSTNAEEAYATDEGIVIRATESGKYYAVTNDGSMYEYEMDVPEAYDVTDWDVTVESWTPGEEIFRTEDLLGVTTTEHTYDTTKTDINVQLDTLTTWDKIPTVGKSISGKGYYSATFQWDGTADGAYLDFGSLVQSMQVTINGQKTADVNMNNSVLDITDYLVVGENTIELSYSSNLTNVQLDRGVIKEQENTGNWAGYDVKYRSYGPEQAVIIPYVEETIEEASEQPVISATAPETAQVNADFMVSVVADRSVTDVKLFNENDMAIGCKAAEVTENDDGTKTFNLTLSVGTVGEGRTFKVVTKGPESYYKDSGVTVGLDITSIPANMVSFDLPESAVANRTFIVTATTDLSATKIEVFNETGMKMGLRSLASKVVDGQKVWTGVMSIGTQGKRTFSCYAVNKYGARSEALTDNIVVRAFA